MTTRSSTSRSACSGRSTRPTACPPAHARPVEARRGPGGGGALVFAPRLAHTDKYVTRELQLLGQAEQGQGVANASVLSGAGSHVGDTQAARGTRRGGVERSSCVLSPPTAVLDGEAQRPSAACAHPPPRRPRRADAHRLALAGLLLLQQRGHRRQVRRRQEGLSRVAVIDFDVHHGNGTEEILSRTAASSSSPFTRLTRNSNSTRSPGGAAAAAEAWSTSRSPRALASSCCSRAGATRGWTPSQK